MSISDAHAADFRFLAGGGELGGLIQAFDWSKTRLGPISEWPQSLKTVTGTLLASPIPIALLWGPEGVMIYNDAYSAFAGSRHPDLLGKEVRKGWVEVADFNDNVMRVGLAGGSLTYRDQELVLDRRGRPEQVWLDLGYSPVLGENGLPAGIIAIVIETTDRVLAEQQLRDGEARLRFLDQLGKTTATATDADIILAATTRMLGEYLGVSCCAYADMDADQNGFTIRGDWTAPGSRSIVGHYSLADFGRRAVKNLGSGLPLVINDVLHELPPHEAEAFRGIGLVATLCMPLVKDGRLTALMAVHDRAPRTWTVQETALLTEVTERSWAHIERVRAEAEARLVEQRFRAELEAKVVERTAALEQSEKSIRTVFETSHQNQGLLTVEGRIVYVNATSLASIKGRLEDVVGKLFWETPWFTGTPGMPEKVREAVAFVAAGGTANVSMPLNMPTGQRSYDFSMRPVKNDRGEVVALVPEAVETTARVKAEQALQQALKMEAIGNLTGGVAHDFNNLLTAVIGSLELLRKRMPDDPKLRKLVDNAMEGANRGSSLTKRMLAFARRQDLKSERIDVSALIGGMAELLERSLGPTIALKFELAPGLSAVEADPNQLESALLNLAVNARDAMNGSGTILISGREQIFAHGESGLKPGFYVCLSVTDTGKGMDEPTLKKATEPFFTTKEIGKGTGLGLSMVHGFAEQSGGTLKLISAPGQGTTAEIWLPAVAPAEPQIGAVEAASSADGGLIVSPPERLSILTVDDDPIVRTSTVAMLEELGHRVTSVSSALEALNLFERARFDLVITDHAMPGMTGAQLVVALRAVDPSVPVILATGFADLGQDQAYGIARLPKPFSLADMAAAVTGAVKR
jgi:signal transduction histidine kinase/CheY-like chemotaxis protein